MQVTVERLADKTLSRKVISRLTAQALTPGYCRYFLNNISGSGAVTISLGNHEGVFSGDGIVGGNVTVTAETMRVP